MKQIYIEREQYNKLIPEMQGKVIKNMVLTYKAGDSDHDYVVITFDDDTYIALKIHETEKDEINYNYIGNAFMYNHDTWLKVASEHIHTDHQTGEVKLYDYMQAMIDIGLYSLTTDEIIEAREKRLKEAEEREYRYYLRLKEKYETNDFIN